MKAFILLLFISVVHGIDQAIVDEFVERVQNLGAECAGEVGASSDDIAELISGQLPPSTHEGKCMLYCVSKGLNMMKANGDVDRQGAINAINVLKTADPELHKKVLRVFVNCGLKTKVSKDPCDTASDLTQCAQTEAKALGLDESILMG